MRERASNALMFVVRCCLLAMLLIVLARCSHQPHRYPPAHPVHHSRARVTVPS